MHPPHVGLLFLSLLVGCSSRGGYAEPGPLSPNAHPPSPAGLHSGSVLQPSPSSGAQGERPLSVNFGGAQVPDHSEQGQAQPPSTECATDADCVAATCCHPTTCAPVARAPSCGGTACSTECAAGTLDCRQGHCACVSGHCGVVRSFGR